MDRAIELVSSGQGLSADDSEHFNFAPSKPENCPSGTCATVFSLSFILYNFPVNQKEYLTLYIVLYGIVLHCLYCIFSEHIKWFKSILAM